MLVKPIWKPPKRKQQKAKNNKRATDQDCCVICQKPFAELHEVFYGVNRKKSILYKMQVRLCMEHHRGQNGVHNNKELDLWLKKKFQQQFEYLYGKENFIKVFGKNYLSEVSA